MLLINCPYCGERPETEFHYGGEAHISRPEDPSALTDEEWAEFLFMRQNKKGFYRERWVHSAGCRRWFNVLRNTHTHEIEATYKVGEAMPKPKAAPKATPKSPTKAATKSASKPKAAMEKATTKVKEEAQ